MSPVADWRLTTSWKKSGHASHDVFRIARNGSRCWLEMPAREAQNSATGRVTDLFTVTRIRTLSNHRKRLIQERVD
jgi:hypothetical protein